MKQNLIHVSMERECGRAICLDPQTDSTGLPGERRESSDSLTQVPKHLYHPS